MATIKEQKEFIKKIGPAAYELFFEKNSIHPHFTIAQAALESGWGEKSIGGNNIFGITKGSWTGKTQLVLTTEYFKNTGVAFKSPEEVVSITPLTDGRFKYRVYRQFRAYDSMSECLSDHMSVLRNPVYADAWPFRKDPKEFAKRISDSVGSKYATDPNYGVVMSSVIDTVSKRINEIKDEKYTSASDPFHIFFRL